MSLTVGDAFPTVPVRSPSGPVDLSERWAQGPLVVAFHRLWCPFCQQAVKELEAARGELQAAGGDAVVIYRQEPETVAGRCDHRGVPFDCLSDPGRELEQAAQLDRFRARRYAAFAPGRLVRALKAGGRIGAINSDLLQGRATYVVGRDGRVAYAHTSVNAADIPPVDELLAAVSAAARG